MITKKATRFLAAVLIIAFIWGGCSIAKQYKAPEVNTENLYRGANLADTNSLANLSYNQVFNDTILQRLINEGLQNNPDLQVAYTRIQQAQLYYQQTGAAFMPTLSANAGVTELKLSEVQGFGIRNSATQYQFSLNSSWEADIWGKLSSNRKASLASFFQTEAASRALKTSIVATIANFYFSLLALDQQMIITRQTVLNWDTTVTTMRALKEAARVTEAAVVQSEALRYAAEVTIPDLKQRIRETENALSILLGKTPGVITRSTLTSQVAVGVLQTGVPAQLLSNRPDVQQAEFNFRYNFELVNVARANFYPTFSLTGSAGLSALSLANFFNTGAIAASIGAGLAQPILNQRLNKTRLGVAQSLQQGALINFQNTLLKAGQEVSDAISLYENGVEKMDIRYRQLNALQKSVEYSQELLRNGFANYVEVVNARQSLLQAELGMVNDRLQQLQATVNLYRSLGGGWK